MEARAHRPISNLQPDSDLLKFKQTTIHVDQKRQILNKMITVSQIRQQIFKGLIYTLSLQYTLQTESRFFDTQRFSEIADIFR
jgi:hypothetical protein